MNELERSRLAARKKLLESRGVKELVDSSVQIQKEIETRTADIDLLNKSISDYEFSIRQNSGILNNLILLVEDKKIVRKQKEEELAQLQELKSMKDDELSVLTNSVGELRDIIKAITENNTTLEEFIEENDSAKLSATLQQINQDILNLEEKKDICDVVGEHEVNYNCSNIFTYRDELDGRVDTLQLELTNIQKELEEKGIINSSLQSEKETRQAERDENIQKTLNNPTLDVSEEKFPYLSEKYLTIAEEQL
jgi:hypothetical protein